MTLRSSRAMLLVALAALATACPDEHDHPHGEHEEAHDAPEDPRPTVVVTLYQSDLELFMEYPALVKGAPSKLIAHFTSTSNPDAFAVVPKGRVTVSLGDATFVADAPARPGVFLPVVVPPAAGTFPLTLGLDGPEVSGTVTLGDVTVFESVEAAAAGIVEAPEDASPVAYLKEAQWKTTYATMAVEPRVLRGGVVANGKLRAVPGKSAELSAPIPGVLVASDTVPHVGMSVRAGQTLAAIAPLGGAASGDPSTLLFAEEEARTELEHAQHDHDRVRALVDAKALPAKRLQEAASKLAVAEARLKAAAQRRSSLRRAQRGGAVASRYSLTSPIDGEVAFADITPGAVVKMGQRLVSVVQTDRLWLEVKVFEDDAGRVGAAPGAEFVVSGFDRRFETEALDGERIAVGPVVDEVSRTVPVIFAIDNPKRALKPGMYAKVTVYSGDEVRGLAVPESALVDHQGRPTVFVLSNGEAFVRRRVRTGVRSGGHVQIVEGLAAGDRVVHQGAYEIELAGSAGSTPAHGHVH